MSSLALLSCVLCVCLMESRSQPCASAPPVTLWHLQRGGCLPLFSTCVPAAPISLARGTELSSSLAAPDVCYKSIQFHIFIPFSISEAFSFKSCKLPACVPLGDTQVSYPYVQMEITFELKIHSSVYELLIWLLRCRFSTAKSCLNW